MISFSENCVGERCDRSHITSMLFFGLFLQRIVHEMDTELITSRNMTIKSGKRLLSGFKRETWYFAHFHKRPDLEFLRSQRIHVSSESIIGKTWLRLFLTREQAEFLVEKMSADLVEVSPDQKIFDTVDTSKGERLKASGEDQEIGFAVECSPGFRLTLDGGDVTDAGNGLFVVKFDSSDPKIEEKLRELAKLEQVFSIERIPPVEYTNRWAVPFVQDNSISEMLEIESERRINAKGLNGEGITILVSDSGLDVNNTFFYDPETELETNKILVNHRKVVYYGTNDDHFDQHECCHGTHVAGTVAGKAICTDCPETLYPGVAPSAKLAFVKRPMTGSQPSLHIEIMEMVNASICSCSWGEALGYFPVLRNTWDKAMLDNPDKLAIFAVGNAGEDGFRIAVPGQAKNVLSVGAVTSLSTSLVEKIVTLEIQEITSSLYEFVLPCFTPAKAGDVFDKQEGCVASNCYQTVTFTNMDNFEALVMGLPFNEKSYLITDVPLEQFFAELDARLPSIWGIFDDMHIVDRRFHVLLTTETAESMSTINTLTVTSVSLPPGTHAPALTMASFSSRGSGDTGILKPEVVAPGTFMKSAGGQHPDATTPGHEHLALMEGTSQATPLVSGSAALIKQYFLDGYYCTHSKDPKCSMTIGSCALRGMIVASADPLESEYDRFGELKPFLLMKPLGSAGFGLVNLANVLPFSGSDDFSLYVVQDVEIKHGEYLVAKLLVNPTANTRDLRIVMTYLDHSLSPESYVPLAVDLDLYVKIPSGEVLFGNSNFNDEPEHFSTVERVLIRNADLDNGEYLIYVHSHDPYKLGVKFSVVCTGPLDKEQREIVFKPAERSELFCMNGGTLSTDNTCQCPEGYLGHLCTLEQASSAFHSELLHNNPVRFRFDVPTEVGNYYLIALHHSERKPQRAILYLSTSTPNAVYPSDFETIIPYSKSCMVKVLSGARISGMIVNLDVDTDEIVVGVDPVNGSYPDTKPTDPDSPKSPRTMNFGAGVAGWVIAAVALVAVIVLLVILCVC